MNRHFEQVKKFHAAAGIEMPTTPTMLDIGKDSMRDFYLKPLKQICEQLRSDKDGGEMYFRASLILEEFVEFMEATTIEDQIDALIDMQYLIIGTFTLMGVKPEGFFDIVANANLGKILPDGTVLRNDQGKIMKPEGWEEKYAPEGKIKEEILLQTYPHPF